MALTFQNEFVVAAPPDPTWQILLDLERVAGCLPGATIEPASEEGTYNGSIRVKVGPVTMDYKGVARVVELDEAAHVAVFKVEGKELRGQGTATATIRNRLIAEGESTRVFVETDLSVTGRPAQFGRGIMQDVAGSMLSDFAKSLSEMIAAEQGA
jgi:carbon monoxide dehydrogenase subunit G